MDVNGMTPSILGQPGKKCTSYKLLVDPNIKKNCQKLIRYDGIVPGQMVHDLSSIIIHSLCLEPKRF